MDTNIFINKLGQVLFENIYINFAPNSCHYYVKLTNNSSVSLTKILPELFVDDENTKYGNLQYGVIPKMPDKLGKYEEPSYKSNANKSFVLNGPGDIKESIEFIKSQDFELPKITKSDLKKALEDYSLIDGWKFKENDWGLRIIAPFQNTREVRDYISLNSLVHYQKPYTSRTHHIPAKRVPFANTPMSKEQLLKKIVSWLDNTTLRYTFSWSIDNTIEDNISKNMSNDYTRKKILDYKQKGWINPKFYDQIDNWENLDKMGFFETFDKFKNRK